MRRKSEGKKREWRLYFAVLMDGILIEARVCGCARGRGSEATCFLVFVAIIWCMVLLLLLPRNWA